MFSLKAPEKQVVVQFTPIWRQLLFWLHYYLLKIENHVTSAWCVTLSLYFLPHFHPPPPFSTPCSLSLSPALSIESWSEPTSVRGRYLVTTEKSIISTKQWGEKRGHNERALLLLRTIAVVIKYEFIIWCEEIYGARCESRGPSRRKFKVWLLV